MWSIRGALLVGIALAQGAALAAPAPVCPAVPGHALKRLTVFDGPPEELASLVPEQDGKGRAYWDLAYVYRAQRRVWVQCHYEPQAMRTMELPAQVNRCTFTSSTRHGGQLWCTPGGAPVERAVPPASAG